MLGQLSMDMVEYLIPEISTGFPGILNRAFELGNFEQVVSRPFGVTIRMQTMKLSQLDELIFTATCVMAKEPLLVLLAPYLSEKNRRR
ncbi:hypothetical protein Q3G72_007697 [Acer saccharum]|nr:hypothetical protein Q3G72_007697 [Acer saccharum]